MPKGPDTHGVQLRALSRTNSSLVPLLFWGQWHCPTASGLVAWWPLPALLSPQPMALSPGVAQPRVSLPRQQQLHVCPHGLLSALLLTLLHDPLSLATGWA